MRNPVSATLVACLSILAAPAAAQEPFRLAPIIVAGGLGPVPQAALGRSVTVLTAEDIRDRQIDQLPELLRSLPGLAVNRSGGPGGLTQLRLRGTEARHVLILVDGVRIDRPQFGEAELAGLQTADIERIEILRGPQSVFFGSNTIGGVVSITTRRPREPGVSARTALEIGSDRTVGLDFGLTRRGPRGGIGLSGILRNEGGFDVSATPGGGRDGMRNRTLALSGDHALTDDWRVGALLRLRRQENDSDAVQFGPGTIAEIVFDRDDRQDIEERIGSLSAEGSLLEGRLDVTLRASRFEHDARAFEAGVQQSDSTATRRELALRVLAALDAPNVAGARHTLGLGLDRMTETFRNNDPRLVFDPSQLERQRRTLTGVALEYRGALTDTLDVQLGLRRDLNDRFRDFTTWSAALSQAFPQTGTRLRASIGTAVQNPTLFDQFGFFPASFVGNAGLRPEQSRGWDIGLEQSLLADRALVSLTRFDNRVTDRIAARQAAGQPPGVLTPVNLPGTARSRGWEAALDAALTDTLRLRGAYTWTDARREDGSRQVRRPRHELALGLDWDATDRTRVSVDARRVVGNLDLDFRGFAFVDTPVVRLPDHTVVNVAARHALTDRVDLTARVNNLFDRQYQEVLGYAAQGRTAYVGLAARF